MSLDNLSHENIKCSAYYHLVAKALKETKTTQTNNKISKAFAYKAFLLAKEDNRTEEMALKVTFARLNNEIEAIKKEIDNNLKNFSILIYKHKKYCEKLYLDL